MIVRVIRPLECCVTAAGWCARHIAPPGQDRPRCGSAGCISPSVAAGQAAGLDLPAIGGHGQVGNRIVLGLAGAVANHRGHPGAMRDLHRVQRLGLSVPIWLTLIRMAFPVPVLMPRRSRSGLVTNKSSPTNCTRPPKLRRQVRPAIPIVLRTCHPRSRRSETGPPGPPNRQPCRPHRATCPRPPSHTCRRGRIRSPRGSSAKVTSSPGR